MADYTPRINLDLDGTLTVSSPSATGKIAPLRTGTRAFLESLRKRGYVISVLTAHKPLIEAREYLRSHGLLALLETVTDQKLPAKLQVDDRALSFNGSYADALKEIDQFRPHWEIGTKHKFSCVMAPLPSEIAAQLKSLAGALPESDIDPQDGRESDFHVTLKFGIESDHPEGARRALSNIGPIRVKLLKLGLFEQPDQEVLKFTIESPDAVRAHEAICKECPHIDTYASYEPHVTVAYLKSGTGKNHIKPTELDGKEFLLNAAVFADRNKNRETIPLRPDLKA